MQSTQTVEQLSRGDGPAIHRYYDIPVESPDGGRILYFEWDANVPGPGSVILASTDRAQQIWLDDSTVAFQPHGRDRQVFRILSLTDGSSREIGGDLRSFCEATGTAAAFRSPEGTDPEDAVKRRNWESWTRRAATTARCCTSARRSSCTRSTPRSGGAWYTTQAHISPILRGKGTE